VSVSLSLSSPPLSLPVSLFHRMFKTKPKIFVGFNETAAWLFIKAGIIIIIIIIMHFIFGAFLGTQGHPYTA